MVGLDDGTWWDLCKLSSRLKLKLVVGLGSGTYGGTWWDLVGGLGGT